MHDTMIQIVFGDTCEDYFIGALLEAKWMIPVLFLAKKSSEASAQLRAWGANMEEFNVKHG